MCKLTGQSITVDCIHLLRLPFTSHDANVQRRQKNKRAMKAKVFKMLKYFKVLYTLEKVI